MAILSNFDSSSNDVSVDNYNIGDVISFASSNIELDDTWLKCDGSNVDESKYPELCKHLPVNVNVTGTWNQYTDSSPIVTMLNDVYYYNGMWVAIGGNTLVNGTYISYTSNPANGWTKKQIGSQLTGVNQSIYCYNGLWVASANTNYIYYTTDPTGTWTEKRLVPSELNMTCYIAEIRCYNGLWVAITPSISAADPSYLFYTTDPTGTWTATNLNVSYLKTWGLDCDDKGNWVISGWQGNGTQYPYILYSSDPTTGNWTGKQLASTTWPYLRNIHYGNGMWIAVETHDGTPPAIHYATDPSGTWTRKVIDSSNYISLQDIHYVNGTWVAVGKYNSGTGSAVNNAVIYYTTDPTGTWTQMYVGTSVYSSLNAIYAHNGNIVAVGADLSNDSTPDASLICYNMNGGIRLPNTSSTNPNTYVKAK